MRKILLCIMPVILMACSTPKYVYYFDHDDSSSGKKLSSQSKVTKGDPSIFELQDEILLADGRQSIMLEDNGSLATNHYSKNTFVEPEAVHSMKKISLEERREIRRELKKELKGMRQSNSDIAMHEDHAKEMDNDLRLAIIFGAVGLTLSLFAGINTAFWVLGVIAVVVGVVFLVRWLLRQ